MRHSVYRRGDVCLDVLESLKLSIAVAHAATIEAKRGDTSRSQAASQQYELPMAADAILWAADDDDHPSLGRRGGSVENANNGVTIAAECQRDLVARPVRDGMVVGGRVRERSQSFLTSIGMSRLFTNQLMRAQKTRAVDPSDAIYWHITKINESPLVRLRTCSAGF